MDSNKKMLIRCLWIYEICVIALCAFGGLNLALMGGGAAIFALPILLVAVAEILRIPLAAVLLKASFGARVLGAIVLLAISVISFEGLSLIFEMAIQNRVSSVSAAEKSFATAQKTLKAKLAQQAQAKEQITVARSEIVALDAKITELIKNQPQAPGFSGRTCGANNSTCAADRSAQETYRVARKDYSKQRSELEALRVKAQQNVAIVEANAGATTSNIEAAAFKAAAESVETLRSASPMHRLASAWFGIPASSLSEDQFQVVKRFIVFSLAGAFATLSALISLVAYSEPRSADAGETKLSRAWRSLLARLRKRVVRTVKVEVPGPERVTIRYIPVPDDQKVRRALGAYESTGEKLRAFKEMI
jgi:hypothetical protein